MARYEDTLAGCKLRVLGADRTNDSDAVIARDGLRGVERLRLDWIFALQDKQVERIDWRRKKLNENLVCGRSGDVVVMELEIRVKWRSRRGVEGESLSHVDRLVLD